MKRFALVAALGLILLMQPSLLARASGDAAEQPTTGTITGRVLNAASGAPLVSYAVYAWNTSSYAWAFTNSSGDYSITIAPGNYHVYSWGSDGYLTQIYPNINCSSCNITTGTLVPVTAGNATPNINFNIALGGRISGYVRNLFGEPMDGVEVRFYDAAGSWSNSAYSDSDGYYINQVGLQTGVYYSRTYQASQYIDEAYGGIWCYEEYCDVPSRSQPISVTMGAETAGIDYDLDIGGRFTGRVVDPPRTDRNIDDDFDAGDLYQRWMTHSSNDNAYVFPSAGQLYFQNYGGVTSASASTLCVAQGNFDVVVDSELVDWSWGSSAYLSLTEVGGRTGIYREKLGTGDFDFDQYALYVQGSLMATHVDNEPTTGPRKLRLRRVGDQLEAYYWYAPLSVWSLLDVRTVPTTFTGFTLGMDGNDADAVYNAAQMDNFVLQADGLSCGIVDAEIQAHDQDANYIRSAFTDIDGRYTTPALGHNYYTAKTINYSGFIDEAFDDITCVNCVDEGDQFFLFSGDLQRNIDYQLEPGSVITGTITDAATALPVSGVFVAIYDRFYNFMVYGYSGIDGVYRTRGLPTGTYYALAQASGRYSNVLYDGRPCESCDILTGDPINTDQPTPFTADFVMTSIGQISGTVTQSGSGIPLEFIPVKVYNSTGAEVATVLTNSGGHYSFTQLAGGTYYVRTANIGSYVNQLYDGLLCLIDCDPLDGTPIVVGPATNAVANFSLSFGARIEGQVRAEGGSSLQFQVVYVYNSSNATIAGGMTNSDGYYLTTAFPPGLVYVVTSASSPYVNEGWQNIICADCLPNTTNGLNVASGVSSDIDFELAPGGWISGTVTSQGAGVPNVPILVSNSSGTQVHSVNTGSDGFYEMTAYVPPGNYFVRTSGAPGALVDELYNNIPCDPSCTVTTGTPVAVAASTETTNINFDLSSLGTISGTVTHASTSVGLSGIEVRLYTGGGTLSATTTTTPTGTYSFASLTPALYYVRTYNTAGFFDEVFNDVPCPANCVVLTGSGILVAAGATQTANFALTPGSRIAGQVTNVTTGFGIQNASVHIYNVLGQLVQTSTTDVDGNYQTFAMAAGTYFAHTTNTGGYIDEMFGDVVWQGGAPGGSPISTTTGAIAGGISFGLGVGGRISGHVNLTGVGAMVGLSVDIYDSTGTFRTRGVTNGAGDYLTESGLPAGSYYARTSGQFNVVHERYDNTACLACSPALGTPIPVTAGATHENINFDLAAGASIAGTVQDNANANPLANVAVKLWDSTGRNVADYVTNASGNYSIHGLPAGSYFLSTDNALGYVNEAYNNVECLTCSPTSVGSAIVLPTGGLQTANISLVRGGSILGRVTNTSGGAGIGGVTVRIYTSTGQLVTTGVTDLGGFYGSRAGLTTGNYYLTTANQSGFIDELYNNIVCLGCTNVTSGTAVAVTLGNNTPNIDIALTPGGRVSGSVKDASLVPINATVMIYSSTGVLVTSGVTTITGSYLTDAGLTTGTYYARTINNRGFIDQRYSGTTCHNPCTAVTSGAPIAVTIGNTTNSINFTLAPGGRISGRVTNDPPTTTYGGVGVNIYSAGGQFVSSTTTDANGVYITSGLPSANYFARSANALGFIDELYDNQTCFGCTIQAGTPIPVVVGTTAANRNFSLGVPGGGVSGRVTSSVNGAGIPNVEVRLFNDVGLVSVLTDATGNYVTPGVPAGSYREIASPVTGYDTRLYNDIPCAGCDLSTGATIAVVVGPAIGGINFVLHPLDPKITLSAYAFEGSGHTVTATIENGPGHRYDWVALYPVNNSNTGYVVGPVYMNGLATPPAVGLSTAQITFSVPTSPGLYNVRLISALGPALALSGSMTVTSQPTVALSTLSVPAGGPVVATIANGPAYRYDYVGFYPVANSNSGYVDWKYMNGQQSPPATGMPNANLQFITPSNLPPGQYNVRLIAVSGITASSPTLTVTAPPTISLSSTTIAAGSSLTATVANGPGSRFDHVGFYPINNGPTGYITFKYLNDTQTAPAVGMTGGTVTFTTATNLTPGQYNVRFRAAAGNVLVASSPLTVTGPPTISGTPSSLAPGANITTTIANGPANRYDYVGLFPLANGDTGFLSYYYLNGTQTAPATGTTSGSFAMVAPSPGQYNLRFFSSSGTKLATSATITVTNPPAVALSTTTPVSGASVTAGISNGPGSRFTWVGLFPIANGNTGFIELKYLNGTTTPPATGVTAADVLFTMPAIAGQYNIRLFDPNSSTPIATSATITVTNTSAIALSGTSVVPGATVTATISGGPGNRYNWAGLFPVTNGNTGYVGATQYLNGLSTPPASGMTGGALTFTMPATPGQYNIRFFPHDSSTPLRISGTITVAAAPTLVPSSTTVTAGTTITATAAGGPGARWDWVGLFPIANSNTGFINMRYLNDSQTAPAVGTTGGTVNFPAPLTPGQYNLRFFYTYGGSTPIATSVTVTVVP